MTQDNRVQSGRASENQPAHNYPQNYSQGARLGQRATAAPANRNGRSSNRWRTVDIIVTVVIAAAVGVIFWGVAAIWNVFEVWTTAFPPLVGLFGGVWVLAGPLAGIIIRKPGAALIAETLAAVVEAVLGSHFGPTAIISGLLQGAGAEIVFLAFFYRKWNLPVMLTAGAGAGLALAAGENIMYNTEWSMTYQVIYGVCATVSSIIISGLGAWLLWKALVPTGALSSFSSGRIEARSTARTMPAGASGTSGSGTAGTPGARRA